MEAGVMKKLYCLWDRDWLMTLSVIYYPYYFVRIPFWPYHFVRTILSATILSESPTRYRVYIISEKTIGFYLRSTSSFSMQWFAAPLLLILLNLPWYTCGITM